MLADLASDQVPFIGGGVVLSLMALLVGSVIRVMRSYPKMYRETLDDLQEANRELREELDQVRAQARREIDVLNRREQRCAWRVSLLIATLQQAGITVPREAWDDRFDARQHRYRSETFDRRADRGADDHPPDSGGRGPIDRG